MKIKNLLIASAAALAGVSSAQAADAIVAAEPEPMEYVRVCDAFGTGYFYIPGTETCLKIGGYVRFQVEFGDDTFDGDGVTDDWDAWTRGRLEVTSKSDTELGTLTGFIAFQSEASQDSTSAVDDPFYFDEVYLQLGGFKAGTYLSWWDNDLAGETDLLSNTTRFTSISYTYEGSAFTAGVQVDELTDSLNAPGASQGVGIEALVRGKIGSVSAELLGAYDIDAEEGAIRAMLSAGVGPGTLYLAGLWSSDPSVYYNNSEWAVAVQYGFEATEKLEIIPEFNYFWNSLDLADNYDGEDYWVAGATVNYEILEGLTSKVNVGYNDSTEAAFGFVRLQRNF